MTVTGRRARKILRQALAGFLFWTTTLTSYMIFFVDTDWSQYCRWIGMQLVIVPVLAPIRVWFIDWSVCRIQGDV